MTVGIAASQYSLVSALRRGLPPMVCAVLLAACGSAPKRGGYYQDDGPPDRAPADLAEAADAVPRVESLQPRANRPYTALGRTYTPLTADVPFRQKGAASWYGRQFHGNRTASGEIYDMFAMTAAHPTLPIPSYARVTNPGNGRSVIVRVNDRGPVKDNRIIDLSYGAATRLGIVSAGTGEVEVERLTNAQIASGEWRRGAAAPPAVASSAPVGTTGTAADAAGGAPAVLPASPLASTLAPASGLPRWSVQIGAFTQQASAEDLAARVATVLGFSEGELPASHREARVERDENLFRVLVGALPDRASALSLAQHLERLLGRPATPFSR
ncbi:MAG TPA: septal ring lytic transglycosylase RlpA family protein [Burkholderiaceae bacterium]|nr:septal ring lytic transglycosylase RlpA family protein [Burkholderiaceae bacterium]